VELLPTPTDRPGCLGPRPISAALSRDSCPTVAGDQQPANPSDGRLGAAAGPEFARCHPVAQVRPAQPKPRPWPGDRLRAESHCGAWRRRSSQRPSRVARSRRSSKRHSASQRQTWSNNVSNCVCASGASPFGWSGNTVLTVPAGIPVFAFLCGGSASADQGIASMRSVCLGSRVDVVVHPDVSVPVRLREATIHRLGQHTPRDAELKDFVVLSPH
jgi:hypothetical protein